MGGCHGEGYRSPRAGGGLVADIEGDFSRISRDKPRRLSSPSDISITSLNAFNLRRTASFGRSQGNWGAPWHSLAAGRRKRPCRRSRKYSSIGNRETSAQGSRFLPRDRPSCPTWLGTNRSRFSDAPRFDVGTARIARSWKRGSLALQWAWQPRISAIGNHCLSALARSTSRVCRSGSILEGGQDRKRRMVRCPRILAQRTKCKNPSSSISGSVSVREGSGRECHERNWAPQSA